MELNWTTDERIPAAARAGLKNLCDQLQQAVGDDLVSVVLYGGLAKGEYSPGRSNVNVMVVLKNARVATLDKAAPPLRAAQREFPLAPLLLTENDLHRSTDVFPVKFLDIQRRHRLLWGKDVLNGLAIGKDHLRLRCEQEIKNLLLRLRRFYAERAHRSELLENTLSGAVSGFLTNLGILLLLKTGQAPDTKPAIAQAAAQTFDLPADVLPQLLALKAGQSRPDAAELKRLYDAFMALVQQAADIVDKL